MSHDMQRLPILLAEALEFAFNSARQLDSEHGTSLRNLPEAVIQLQIKPLHTPFYCLVTESQISVQTHLNGDSDATISADAIDWVGLPKGDLNRFALNGNTELAEQFLQTLAGLDIDWEEHLSKLTGDLIAYKVGSGVRQFIKMKRNQRDYVMQTVSEYLKFELQAVPTKSQVKRFANEVAQLEQELQQLEARFAKIDGTHNASE